MVNRRLPLKTPTREPSKHPYGVKTVYRSWVIPQGQRDYTPKPGDPVLVEERIVLFLALSREDAIRQAHKEARRYARLECRRNVAGDRIRCQYLGEADEYWIPESIAERCELYAMMQLLDGSMSPTAICALRLGGLGVSDEPHLEQFKPARK